MSTRHRTTPAFALTLAATFAALPLASTAAQEPERGPQSGIVSGQVVDSETGRPIGGVLVKVGQNAPATTDRGGFFAVGDIGPGRHDMLLSHLAYGDHERDVLVQPGQELSVTIRLSVAAIELEPFLVEARAPITERQRASGNSINEISRDRIEAAADAGLGLTQLLQTSMPGVRTYRAGAGRMCVTYRGARSAMNGCPEVSVVLDGVHVGSPSHLYENIPLSSIERVEMLSPGQASLRYGTGTGQAVLIIETRRPTQPQRGDASRFVTGFDWAAEEGPYEWARVLGTTFLVNAVVVGGSLALAERCLSLPEVGPLGLRSECNGVNTASLGLLSVGLPAVTGGFVAGWSGATDRTKGRFAPTAIAGAMALTGGYLLMMRGGGSAQHAGYGMLAVGVPLTLTFADRIFRVLR